MNTMCAVSLTNHLRAVADYFQNVSQTVVLPTIKEGGADSMQYFPWWFGGTESAPCGGNKATLKEKDIKG